MTLNQAANAVLDREARGIEANETLPNYGFDYRDEAIQYIARKTGFTATELSLELDRIEYGEPECLGHPAGPFDAMGETVYCDGSCRR